MLHGDADLSILIIAFLSAQKPLQQSSALPPEQLNERLVVELGALPTPLHKGQVAREA